MLLNLSILYSSRLFSLSGVKTFHSLLYRPKIITLYNKYNFYHNIMDLCSVVKSLDTIVPKQLAEKWDNTGLLVEPLQKTPISTVFFTNDLTEDVLEEALSLKANLIVSYHPPLFTAFKSLSCKNWKDRIIMKCIANNIAIYSPHTACDAVEGGVNDWLLKCFDVTCILPIKPVHEVNSHVIECFVKEDVNFNTILGANIDFTILMRSSFEDSLCYKILINSAAPTTVCQMLLSNPSFLTVTSKECALSNASKLTGMGRIGTTKEPLKLNECIQLVKNHLKLKNLRFALGGNCTLDTEISTIAVCAGSGASLLKGVPADLYVTGEMSHHDLLDAIHKKTSVILCEHSNSERGYLVNLANELQHKLHSVHPDCKLIVSKIDKDPVSIV